MRYAFRRPKPRTEIQIYWGVVLILAYIKELWCGVHVYIWLTGIGNHEKDNIDYELPNHSLCFLFIINKLLGVARRPDSWNSDNIFLSKTIRKNYIG